MGTKGFHFPKDSHFCVKAWLIYLLLFKGSFCFMLDARNQHLFQERLHSIWWCWDLWKWHGILHIILLSGLAEIPSSLVRSVCKIVILLNCQPIKNNKLITSSAPVPPHRSHFAWHASWKDFPPFHVRLASGCWVFTVGGYICFFRSFEVSFFLIGKITNFE